MVIETTNINYSTDLGINYIPCCVVVLMQHNVCICGVAWYSTELVRIT